MKERAIDRFHQIRTRCFGGMYSALPIFSLKEKRELRRHVGELQPGEPRV